MQQEPDEARAWGNIAAVQMRLKDYERALAVRAFGFNLTQPAPPCMEHPPTSSCVCATIGHEPAPPPPPPLPSKAPPTKYGPLPLPLRPSINPSLT